MNNKLESQDNKLISLSSENINKIKEGLYLGKPLLGKEGLLQNLIKGYQQHSCENSL